MKVNDAIWGALCLLLGAALLFHIRNFPAIPGQQYGPALMPGVVAVGLGVCGMLLVLKGLAVRRAPADDRALVRLAPWTRVPQRVVAFAVSIGVNVFYVYAVTALGFVLTGTVYLAAMFAVLDVKRGRILPLALIVTLVIHYVFYKLLRVPLPWGVLQGIAWF